MRKIVKIAFLLCPLSALFLACDDDETTGSTPQPDAAVEAATATDAGPDTSVVDAAPDVQREAAAATGSVVATVNYAGSATGTLSVGIFTQVGTPPVVGARLPGVTFPYQHTFPVVSPGQYLVLTYVDVGDNNFAGPGPGDPVAPIGAPITVKAGEATTTTLTIEDPPDAG